MSTYEQQVEILLAPPPPRLAQAYLDEVCRLHSDCSGGSNGNGDSCSGPAVEVQLDAGGGRGKGIFARRCFSRGDTLFKERPLVAIQHGQNRCGALVCDHCFVFLGSIEQQVSRKLLHTLTRHEQRQQRQHQHHQQHQQKQNLPLDLTGDGTQAAPEPRDGPGADAATPAGPSTTGKRPASGPAEAVAADAGAAVSPPDAGASSSDDDASGGARASEDDAEEDEALDAMVSLIAAAGVDAARLRGLADGEPAGGGFPLSDRFPLPAPVLCRHGCGAAYCGAACEAASWELHHALLCPGPDPGAGAGPSSTVQSGGWGAEAGGTGSGLGGGGAEAGGCMSGSAGCGSGVLSRDTGRLRSFYAHAARSNEIFQLAAKVIAVTLRRAEALLQRPNGGGDGGGERSTARDGRRGDGDSGGGSESKDEKWPLALLAADAALASSWGSDGGDGSGCGSGMTSAAGREHADAQPPSSSGANGAGTSAAPAAAACTPERWAALRQAWLPFACGWKQVWWRAVVPPPDVDDADSFREQLRWLAGGSLKRLRAVLPHAAAAYAPLFSDDVYGAIVGMFELNNLGLAVPSPVEDYFLLVDGLPEGPEKEAVRAVSQPFLDALDKRYDEGCEGTGFYALQSCVNHSCCPLATAEGEATGEASILALGPIPEGCEVTLSYIDDEAGFKERTAALRDYGFRCTCDKCQRDRARRAAALAKKAGRT